MCPFFTTQLDSQRGQFGILFPPDLPPAHFTSLPVDDYPITGFICALLLLRRWGAEPGIQIFFPLLLSASFFMISRLVGTGLIPNIDGVVAHLVLPALIHFMLVFPTPSRLITR